MKNLSICLLFLLLSASTIYGKNVKIHKRGGRVNSDGTLTYRVVDFEDNSYATNIRCVGSGPNECPTVGVITVGIILQGQEDSVSLDEVLKFLEKTILSNQVAGKTIYKGIFVAWRKGKIIKKTDGSFDVEYQAFISDEIHNENQFNGWNSH